MRTKAETICSISGGIGRACVILLARLLQRAEGGATNSVEKLTYCSGNVYVPSHEYMSQYASLMRCGGFQDCAPEMIAHCRDCPGS